jgi:hypothetical protein
MYFTGEAEIDYFGSLVLHKGHFNVEEAQKLITDQGYDDKVIDVTHFWATWGIHSFEGELRNGWWVIDRKRSYRHKKKMTRVEIKRAD